MNLNLKLRSWKFFFTVITFYCDVHRFKDNKELQRGDRYQLQSIDKTVSMKIPSTEETDAAMYRCEATNKLGQVYSEAALTVHSKSPPNEACLILVPLFFFVYYYFFS